MESKKAYEWKGFYSHKVSADVAGRVMEELENTVGLTPKNLVEVSRPENAPLHEEFEWDDSIAAEKYRETQASGMIRNITIKVENAQQTKQVRAFVTLANNQSGPKSYESIGNVMSCQIKREKLIDNALRELRAFRNKYKQYTELADLIAVFDDMMEKIEEIG